MTGPVNSIKRLLGSTARTMLRPFQTALSRYPHVRAYFFDTMYGPFAISAGPESFVVSTSDGVIGRELYARYEFDLDKFGVAQKLLGRNLSDCVFVDVGANVGSICLPLVKRHYVGSAIAIEPEPLNFRLLSANLWINDVADKVKCHNVAVGAESGSIQFELSNSNFGDHRVSISTEAGAFDEQSRNKISVRMETLDSLLPEELDHELFLWVDTQGYEGFVLQGAVRLMSKKVPLVVEFWPYGMERAKSFEPFLTAVSSAGYTLFYDLEAPSKAGKNADRESLVQFYEELKKQDRWTDLLFT
ncbi:FkbM family methyltransferase [Nostoc sp. CHAB 5824]|nr:FkbM family methyltransferase [Nostoc sp. CHAB 5824]